MKGVRIDTMIEHLGRGEIRKQAIAVRTNERTVDSNDQDEIDEKHHRDD